MALSFEEIYNACSQFGFYNIIVILAVGLLNSYSAINNLASNFLTAHADHWCRIPPLENLTADEQRHLAIPWDDETGEYESCRMYDIDWSNVSVDSQNTWNQSGFTADIIDCQHGWTFDTSVFQLTAQIEFSLVCDKAWLLDLVGPTYVAGFWLGASISGLISNKLGRKRTLLLSVGGAVLAGLLAALSPNIYVYLVARFLVAIFIIVLIIVGNVLLMEVTPRKFCGLAGVIYQCFYPLGTFILAGCAYYIRDFRFLSLIISMIGVLFFLYQWLLPRSPRWLLWKGDEKGAVQELVRMAQYNRIQIPPEILEEGYTHQMAQVTADAKAEPETSHGGYSDIFRRPKVLLYVVSVTIIWLNVNFTYSGVSFNMDGLFGDVYMTMILSGVLELPAGVVAYIALSRRGRRLPLLLFNSVMIVSALVAVPILLLDMQELEMVTTLSAILCRSCAFGSGLCLNIYAAELFPTCIRNHAISIATSVAYLITITAPFVAGSLTHYFEPLPYLVYSGLSAVSVYCAYILPETHNRPLPETIDDLLNMNRSDTPNPDKIESQVPDVLSLAVDNSGDVVVSMTMGVDNVAFILDKIEDEDEKVKTTVVDILNEAGISYISDTIDVQQLAGPFQGLVSRQTSVASGIPNISISYTRQNSSCDDQSTRGTKSAGPINSLSSDEKVNCDAPSGGGPQTLAAASSVACSQTETSSVVMDMSAQLSSRLESLARGPVLLVPDPQGCVVEGEFPGSSVPSSGSIQGAHGACPATTRQPDDPASRRLVDVAPAGPVSWLPGQARSRSFVPRRYRPYASNLPELLSYRPLYPSLLLP